MDQKKIDPADLDSPRRELSNGGLGFVVAFLVRSGINFLSFSGSQVGVRALDNIVLICTSDVLVRADRVIL